MGGKPYTPPRCESCGCLLAIDEIEAMNAEWAAEQSFDDWWITPDPDLIEALQNAVFVGQHPSFASGDFRCPSCRKPFTIGDLSDAYSDPFSEETPW